MHRRLHAQLLLAVIAVITTAGAVLPATASAANTLYFNNGISGGAVREFSNFDAYMTSNGSAVYSSNQVVCVQEKVYPNYPSGSGSFFDNYDCGSHSVAHLLNGASVDNAVCWVNGSPVVMRCNETY